MSANNWAVCPRCKYRHEQMAIEKRQKADASYGKVPVEKWKAMDVDARDADSAYEKRTWREDYEIYGAEEGVVEVSYGGVCGVCGLSCSLKHSVDIEGIKA